MSKTVYRLDPTGEAAMEKVLEQGFEFPESPVNQPRLPSDLDEIDTKDLMEQFLLFTAWADYASAQVGLASIAERSAEMDLEWHISRHYESVPSRKSVTVAKAEVLQNPDVYEARKAVEEAYAYKRVVSDLAARYERDAAVLSRELTRRTTEFAPKATRRDRWES